MILFPGKGRMGGFPASALLPPLVPVPVPIPTVRLLSVRELVPRSLSLIPSLNPGPPGSMKEKLAFIT